MQVLASTPPSGEAFLASVKVCTWSGKFFLFLKKAHNLFTQHVLDREQTWVEWKNEGCPSLERRRRPAVEDEDEEGEEDSGPRPAKRIKGIDMGAPELTRLWNQPGNFETCANPQRIFLPSPSEYFAEAIKQFDATVSIKPQKQ